MVGRIHKNVIIIIGILSLLYLSGCLNMDKSGEPAYEKENYVPIQEYTGEGFTLRDANPKTGEIAEANREVVVTAVEQFFLNEYKAEVEIHNIVSGVDGVSVFVESVGYPHFYSFAIVPVDIKNREVETDRVWSQEGQVENAIQGGLYAMAFQTEFNKLDEYLEAVTQRNPIVGSPLRVVERVKANGYTTAYYFISTFDEIFDNLFEVYMERPNITEEELQDFFHNNSFDPDGLSIGIEFYMKEKDADPNEKIYDEIYKDIEKMKDIPKGEYYLFLNDNFIDRKRAIGKKDNTLDKTIPHGIMKD